MTGLLVEWWLALRHRRLWMLLSLAMIAAVIVGSLMPGQIELPVRASDKW